MSKNCETEYKKWKNMCSFPKYLKNPICCKQLRTKYLKCQGYNTYNRTKYQSKNIKPIR